MRTVYPTNAAAQEADMSLSDYQDFVYGACLLDEPDPIAAWQAEGAASVPCRAGWRARSGRAEGSEHRPTLSITGRRFTDSDGKRNFPSGEIFTGPVEDSVNGWVRFRYPAIFSGGR